MLEAAEEVKVIAIRDGNVDSDGVPMCTVVADGAWCKRSYKANYDSLSGVYLLQNLLYFCVYHFCFQASIVGFKTGKVLYYIGVRNRCCSI
ncbi:hypothetical protein PR048_001083 [Dryococelus australis]|uniref:Mutator-like transposase domain-containing protein n=1 Tax=Dryococelus australis TaxID=614101 RepID=A0ABQ9IGE5_9NEOP|nr:hypothetical protein PR048_001083 [Dryococelus australis]